VRKDRRWLLAGTIAALLCVLASIIAATVPAGSADPSGGSALAVVLIPGMQRSELVVVDLDKARVVRRIALRSLVTDIDADAERGTVIGAQTGGLGVDADDAISVADPRTGEVRYVTLPRTDPSQVECVAGRAVVLHSWVDGSGFVVSAVHLASGSVVATGYAPDGTGMWAAAGGRLWTAAVTQGPQRFALVSLDPTTLAVTSVDGLGITPSAVVDAGDGVAVLGSAPGDVSGTGRVLLLDPDRATVVASSTVSGLSHGPQAAAMAGEFLVIGDWVGEAPESDALAVLDGRTLQAMAQLRVGSAPCALAGYGDRLLVVDRLEGVLRSVDPATGEVEWTVDLGARNLLCSKVAVLGPGSGATPPSATGTP
jgi:hypothetical protein